MNKMRNHMEEILSRQISGFHQYVLNRPMHLNYPWNLPEAEAALTEERIDEILTKYVAILTDAPVEIDYQSVENSG